MAIKGNSIEIYFFAFKKKFDKLVLAFAIIETLNLSIYPPLTKIVSLKLNLHTHAYGNKRRMQTKLEIKQVQRTFLPLPCSRSYFNIMGYYLTKMQKNPMLLNCQ